MPGGAAQLMMCLAEVASRKSLKNIPEIAGLKVGPSRRRSLQNIAVVYHNLGA
jgi:hypothetical protein